MATRGCGGGRGLGAVVADALPPVTGGESSGARVVEVGGMRSRVPAMVAALERIRRFAALDVPVLVEGETGTGKELVATALHALGRRASGPLVAVNCAALPESIAESELFGRERGAFTGADRAAPGRLESAAGGTLFLDEVNSLSLASQAKLLRFLETGEVVRVGGERTRRLDVRLVAATNESLDAMVAAGRARADFVHRLGVLRVVLPPLRARLDDLPLLVGDLLAREPLARERGVRAVSPAYADRLREHDWPGNVRELRNVLLRALALAEPGAVLSGADPHGESRPDPWGRGAAAVPDPPAAPPARGEGGAASLAEFRPWIRAREVEYLTLLARRHPSIAAQAAASGLPERTLYRKLRSLRIAGLAGV